MEQSIQFNNRDTIVMKLLHYFIINENYNPVVLHGAKNEIWLENMHSNYKIVRIVSEYIHNDEQLDMDIFKTKKISQNIKRKTFNLSMNVLSIYVDLGENVNLKNEKNIDCININKEKDFKNYQFIYETFPDIDKKLVYSEEGIELFLKITNEINEKNKTKSENIDKVFAPKKPIMTYFFIAINIIAFIFEILSNGRFIDDFALYGPYVKDKEYYRLLTTVFLHGNLIHLICNMYSLKIIGTQVESFFGKIKFTIIYLLSGITGSLLSMLLNFESVSVGASGAIFGLLGALLFFGYNYRAYLGNYMVNNILPVVVLNLGIGFILPGIDNFAHIGGLVGGLITSVALGLNAEGFENNKKNGIIILILYVAFLIFMNFYH